jgi:hypothetical protein
VVVVTNMTRAVMRAIANSIMQNRLLNRRNQTGPGGFNPYPRPSKQASQPGYMKPNIQKRFRRSR